jgi:hypothetical protein
MRPVFQALIVGITLLAAPLQADSTMPGIQFDLMPVGCRIHGLYNSGEQVVDEYIGVKRGKHVVRTFEGPKGRKLIRTTTYDAQGFMVRKDWAGGQWETFTPFSCFARLGVCTYTYRNGDGDNLTYRGKVTRRGGKIVSRGGFDGGPPFPESVVTVGPFNANAAFREGNTSYRVTRYENCGDGLPSS